MPLFSKPFIFRTTGGNEPVREYGIVFARNLKELYWLIDEFVDPNHVEVKQLDIPIGICFHDNCNAIGEETDSLFTHLNISGLLSQEFDNENWIKVNFDRDILWKN